MFLLDTNVISETFKLKRQRADVNFSQWIYAQSPEHLYTSAINLMEIDIGILRLARKDPRQAKLLQDWFHHQVLPFFEYRTLAFDGKSALICSRLHVPNPRPERDCMIGSIALQHNLTVVTRNVKDFAIDGLSVFNPF